MKYIILTITLFSFFVPLAQQMNISGQVLDEAGLPLPGASVIIDGTSTGTTTDFDGQFSLQVEPKDVIVITYVGYKGQNFIIQNGQTVYNATLSEDLAKLDEIVVVGYKAERKSDIAGAITVVNVGEIAQESSPNIITNLQGRVPGIQVNSDGTPGGNGSQIAIRGLTTVSAGSSPLWVIDGVQTFNPSSLNASEIESIQVLKDGASVALYGTSGANGVIVVTTKKGANGVSEFTFQSETTINMMRDKIELLNGEEWARVYYQARANDGIFGDFSVLKDNGSGFDIPEFLDDNKLLRAQNTNWVDAITHNSVSYNTDFSYRYGNDKLKLFSSLHHARDNGIQKFTFYERFNARVNASYKFWDDKITIGENLLYSNFNEVKANQFETAILQNPLLPVFTEIGTYSAPVIQDKGNALANLYANSKNESRNHRILGNIYANVNFLKGFTFNTALNFEYAQNRFETRTIPYTQMTLIPNVFQNINLSNSTDNFYRTIFTNMFSYEKILGKHRINALAGLEFTRQDSDFVNDLILGVDITDYPTYIIRSDAEFRQDLNEVEYRKYSQFGSLKYIFDDKYIIAGSIRRDGSSRFGPNNKYAVLPAVELAWNASNEKFISSISALSNLKFRASYGVNGNDIIGNYLYLDVFGDNSRGGVREFGQYDIDGDGYGVSPGVLQLRQANPDVKWEQTYQYNFGFDVGFLNNKLSLTADLFDKRTVDLLLQPIALAIYGEADPPIVNAGEISNKGFEFVIGYKNSRKSDLKYGIDFSFSHYKNNVESLDTDNNFLINGVSITRPGDPIASFYGLIADGIFRTPEEVAVHADQQGKGLGRIRYRDINNDGVVNTLDRTIIGNPHPDFIYGINLNASFKNFDLSAYFDGKQGHDLYNNQRRLLDFNYFAFNFGRNTLDAWSPDNANSNIPALSTNNSNNELATSSYFIEDGSYLRLKNITIGYSISPDKLDKMGLNSLRFYLTGQNLFTITSFTGFDYEVGGLSPNGIGVAGYGIPHSKSVTFGTTLKF